VRHNNWGPRDVHISPHLADAVLLFSPPPQYVGAVFEFYPQCSRSRADRRVSAAEDQEIHRLGTELSDPSGEIAKQMPGGKARQVREPHFHYLFPSVNLSTWAPEEYA
jgi:hypothetical protein